LPTLDTNMLNRATTQYNNFPFTEYCNTGHCLLAIGPEGVYQIGCGTSDGEEKIDAWFHLNMTDFGISNPKRLRFMYFGFESDEDLKVTVYADEVVKREYFIPSYRPKQQRTRIPIGRDVKGRYWSFKIANINGCDFSMDSIMAMVVILNEGHV